MVLPLLTQLTSNFLWVKVKRLDQDKRETAGFSEPQIKTTLDGDDTSISSPRATPTGDSQIKISDDTLSEEADLQTSPRVTDIFKCEAKKWLDQGEGEAGTRARPTGFSDQFMDGDDTFNTDLHTSPIADIFNSEVKESLVQRKAATPRTRSLWIGTTPPMMIFKLHHELQVARSG